MKNILKYTLSALLVGGTLFSCSEDDADDLNFKNLEENSVHFKDSGLGVAEASSSIIQLVGFYSSTQHDSDVSAAVAVEGSSADYQLVDSDLSFNFPAGVYSDTIFIQLNDNFDTDGNRDLVFSLASASNGATLGYPGPAANLSTFTLTVIDDDCEYTLQGLGDATWSGSDNATGDQGPNASQITTSYDGTNLFMEGIAYGWLTGDYWDEVIVDSYPVMVDIAADGIITIPMQPLCTTTWLGDPQPAYSIQATGLFESCSDRMTINYELFQGGALLTSFTEVITKN